ncbi:MAG: alpha/beta hydrolase [Microcella sp.]|uniref:alpha/beta hydrolase n=1 Tax=Microcella sp. TaxID=1913979 RepID=UPI0024C5E353|nr:alpha/beta hydrolase [Microcella sp.]UYN82821.1 MAG: alpha/beta hydrolase [Microcella sp.]
MIQDALPTINLDEWPHLFTEGATADAPVVLTLHGTGGDEREIAALGTALVPGAAVLSPRGRVLEGRANRWFRRLSEGVFDVDDVIARAAELAAFVVAAQSRYALENRTLIATGFSNGANIALATALLHPTVVSRVVAFSGMHPFGDRELQGSSQGVELLLLNGDHDPMAPAASVAQLEGFASGRGASVTRHTRPGGHGVDGSEVQAAKVWLAR